MGCWGLNLCQQPSPLDSHFDPSDPTISASSQQDIHWAGVGCRTLTNSHS